MNINDLKSIDDFNKLDDGATIVVNDEVFNVDELTQRVLTVHGAQPSDYEEWQHVNVLALLRNKKPNAGGSAQKNYRYPVLEDLPKFHEHQYPYKLPIVMAESADKNGNVTQFIVYADFANVTELKLVPRKVQAQQPKQVIK